MQEHGPRGQVEAIVLNTVLAVCVHAPDMLVMEELVRETKEYELKRSVQVRALRDQRRIAPQLANRNFRSAEIHQLATPH